ncbi:MAG TPA: CCA tRNA nucleotidyltransferase [Candidatus Pelethocola excrementipullorum]|nr:CCA tRNA nucleotidyltransferase [Candidatus Pelethocola excrementipullorum]
MRLNLPASVDAIIDSLQANGYEAYAVGGCVRDSILGCKPDDWDITTSATPWQVKEIFNRTVDTGLQHGTVTVLMGNYAHEVTTYRIDGDYEDGRHPKEVTFTASLEEDLKRRDFTINAMAYNDKSGLIDLYGGIEDLQRKCIRCVGNAEERFGEDALRIMRALRFSAQLDFGIDQETYDAVRKLSPTLAKISAERISTELTKLLMSGHPEYIQHAYDTGITKVILPEFDAVMDTPQNNPHHCYNVGRHTIESLKYTPADKVLRLTMLLHDMGKPACRTTDEDGIDHFIGHAMEGMELARDILQRLKFDNDTIYQVTNLIKWHDCRMEPSLKTIRKILNKIGPNLFDKLLTVQYADTMAQSGFCRKEKIQRITEVEACFKEILDSNQCISLKDLELTGQDLIAMGLKPGPQIGQLLNQALDQVLEEPEKNERNYLLAFIDTIVKSEEVSKI